jgi:hypothetical protein
MYPKNFFETTKIRERAGTCFVLMPFASSYTEIFSDVIRPTLEKAGFNCFRADDLFTNE